MQTFNLRFLLKEDRLSVLSTKLFVDLGVHLVGVDCCLCCLLLGYDVY
jgi:hypothetical protein